MIATYEKEPSANVAKFLGAMHNKSTEDIACSSKKQEKTLTLKKASQPAADTDFFTGSNDVPANYEHGKAFVYNWDLEEMPWELRKFHSWIMKAMKKGITAITGSVPNTVFLNPRSHQVVIDFEDLHRLYRRQHMDVNLVRVWCL